MDRILAVGIAFLSFHTVGAFADTIRGDEASSRGQYSTAEREWRESALAGDGVAMLNLGTLYDTGHGVSQNFAEALSWYRRAADAGNPAAMFNVGAMYDNGRGTGTDRAEAVRWYAKAARRGNGRAAYAAATIYRDGDGIRQDKAAAIKFFRMAAAAGVGAARLNLTALGDSASGAPAKAAAPPRAMADAATEPLAPPAAQPKAPGTAAVATQPFGAAPPVPVAVAAGAAVTQPAAPESVQARVPEAFVAATLPGTSSRAAGSIGVKPAVQPPDPPAVQHTSLNSEAAGIESFHRTALQRTDVSAAMSKQYEAVAHEVARKAVGADPAARYDAGFAYERGIGLPSDLVRSYVYYILATLSPDAGIKAAALKGAFEVGGRLTDAQHAVAADMLLHGIP